MDAFTIRLLIVDDHALFRNAIMRPLEEDPRIDIVGSAPDGEFALSMCATLQPDVVLADLHMPKLDGFELLAELGNSRYAPAVLILTGNGHSHAAQRALAAGAKGYMLKDNVTEDNLVNAICIAAEGGIYVDPSLLSGMLSRALDLDKLDAIERLSASEIQLLQMVAHGRDNKEIAAQLTVSSKTVSNRLSLVYNKLGIRNRVQAANLAYRSGLVAINAVALDA